jgi:ABC-type bacteriocin/lantibiotic exporter with double-glycine peptidase domain
VFLVGGIYVISGELEFGTVVAFVAGMAKLNDPWGDLVNYFRDATVAQMKYRLVADSI